MENRLNQNSRPHVLAVLGDKKLIAGAVHTHSTISDGQYSPEELVQHAHNKGLGAVFITDHHCNDWRYRWGIKFHRKSVLSYGLKEYFTVINSLVANNPGPIVLPGIEIMPHYRWTGIFPFICCHSMKNIVVFGINDFSIFEKLPISLDGRGKNEEEALETAQRVIDYIHKHLGLTYWSHLESNEKEKYLSAKMEYRPRPDILVRTSGYTGFGCFPEGFIESCKPGGYWDRCLENSLKNNRCNGPWIFGEADYHSGDRDEPYRNICNPTTVFSIKNLEPTDLLNALKCGKMYAYMGNDFRESFLHEFSISGTDGSIVAEAGDIFQSNNASTLRLKISGFSKGCRLRIICGGRIWKEADTRECTISLPPPVDHGYACRVDALSPNGEHIMTNPIFVVNNMHK